VACVARSADKLAETVAAITSAGGVGEAFSCDVKVGASVDQLIDGIAEKWGKLDILVNNAGVEFAKPLAEPVFDKLIQEHEQLPESAIKDLRKIASRTHWLARQASDDDIAILADLSRQCAVDAVVEGLRLGEAPKKR